MPRSSPSGSKRSRGSSRKAGASPESPPCSASPEPLSATTRKQLCESLLSSPLIGPMDSGRAAFSARGTISSRPSTSSPGIRGEESSAESKGSTSSSLAPDWWKKRPPIHTLSVRPRAKALLDYFRLRSRTRDDGAEVGTEGGFIYLPDLCFFFKPADPHISGFGIWDLIEHIHRSIDLKEKKAISVGAILRARYEKTFAVEIIGQGRFFLPYSVVDIPSEAISGDSLTLIIPRWLALERGLIMEERKTRAG